MTGRRATTIVGAPPGHAERLGRVVMARPPDDYAAGGAGVRLATVVGSIRIGAERGRRPLSQVAEHVLDAIGAGAGGPARGVGRVVGASKDRELGRRRCEAPGGPGRRRSEGSRPGGPRGSWYREWGM